MKQFIASAIIVLCLVSCSTEDAEHPTVEFDVSSMTVRDIQRALSNGEITSATLMQSYLENASRSRDLNAFISVGEESALKSAKDADTRIGVNKDYPPLLGIPIVVKDNIHVAGMTNTAGTPSLLNYVPETSNPIVEKLQAAGAFVLGKTNMHELAFGVTSNNAHFGAVGNPHNESMFAGGSSGGTAAAIAAGLAPAGLGTDTGGSVRIPAALTGIVGYRPSSGLYDSSAVTPISSTRDTVGLMARDVSDVILLHEIIVGERVPAFKIVTKIRLGVPRDYFFNNLDVELAEVVDNALAELQNAGITLVETDIHGIADLILATGFPIVLHEVVRELPEYLDAQGTNVSYEELASKTASADVKSIFGMLADGGPIDDEAYAAALEARKTMQQLMQQYFASNNLDGMIFPTTILPARPKSGSDETVELNGQRVPTFPAYIQNTEQATIAGLPSISIPVGMTASGLPVGLDLEGPAGADAIILAVALAIEEILENAE